MTELPWLEDDGPRSTDELIALAADHRVDSIVVAFDAAIQRKEFYKGRNSLSEVELTVVTIEALENEVCNGGYWQFFTNTSNEYVGDVVAALERIGATDIAHLTRVAITSLGIGPHPTTEQVAAAIALPDEARDSVLDELTDDYFALAGALSEPLFEYLKANRQQVVLLDGSD